MTLMFLVVFGTILLCESGVENGYLRQIGKDKDESAKQWSLIVIFGGGFLIAGTLGCIDCVLSMRKDVQTHTETMQQLAFKREV